ncbi:unnamed protein product, partial [marine sediment metagenome]
SVLENTIGESNTIQNSSNPRAISPPDSSSPNNCPVFWIASGVHTNAVFDFNLNKSLGRLFGLVPKSASEDYDVAFIGVFNPGDIVTIRKPTNIEETECLTEIPSVKIIGKHISNQTYDTLVAVIFGKDNNIYAKTYCYKAVGRER